MSLGEAGIIQTKSIMWKLWVLIGFRYDYRLYSESARLERVVGWHAVVYVNGIFLSGEKGVLVHNHNFTTDAQ